MAFSHILWAEAFKVNEYSAQMKANGINKRAPFFALLASLFRNLVSRLAHIASRARQQITKVKDKLANIKHKSLKTMVGADIGINTGLAMTNTRRRRKREVLFGRAKHSPFNAMRFFETSWRPSPTNFNDMSIIEPDQEMDVSKILERWKKERKTAVSCVTHVCVYLFCFVFYANKSAFRFSLL